MDPRELSDYYHSFSQMPDEDLELLIIHLQYLRVKRKRDWHAENYKPYKFCDACTRTYTYYEIKCIVCGTDKLRPLPVWDKFSYLLDDHVKRDTEGNIIEVLPKPKERYYPV